MLPMFVLSGVFFSASRFPDAVQPFIRALPLTALNDALRAVYNDAAPVSAYAGELGLLLAWSAGAFLLALRLFRWQ
jgi:ABC-2 type transport system permease protein